MMKKMMLNFCLFGPSLSNLVPLPLSASALVAVACFSFRVAREFCDGDQGRSSVSPVGLRNESFPLTSIHLECECDD